MGVIHPWPLYFYYPQEKSGEAKLFINRLNSIQKLKLAELKSIILNVNLGELAPHYRGFQEIEKNFVLATGMQGNLSGFCAFILERIDLIQIDIILVAREWRRKGLGRYLVSVLEQACLPGAVIYVDQVTETGRKFFISCGFTKDVNLFKITGNDNRSYYPAAAVSEVF